MSEKVYLLSRHGYYYYYDMVHRELSICDPREYQLATSSRKNENDRNCTKRAREEAGGNYYNRRYSAIVTGDQIKNKLSNVGNICFEVTTRCNMRCAYCAYGKIYTNRTRAEIDMDYTVAKNIIDYHIEACSTTRMIGSNRRKLRLSFYGGEPLLAMDLIERIVDYSKRVKWPYDISVTYGLTTNGTEIDKHIPFFVDNDFDMLISHDGPIACMKYRVMKDGNSSYDVIEKNVDLIKSKYPKYYDKRVSFLAVLNNYSSIDEIREFFMNRHNKVPLLGEIVPYGVRKRFRPLLNMMRKTKNMLNSDCGENRYDYNPNDYWKLRKIIDRSIFWCYQDYNELFLGKSKSKYFPTATCLPFGKSLFACADGDILQCEKIDKKHKIGRATIRGVYIDYGKVAQDCMKKYERILSLCNMCYNIVCDGCLNCMDDDGEGYRCLSYMDKDTLRNMLEDVISDVENSTLVNIRNVMKYRPLRHS